MIENMFPDIQIQQTLLPDLAMLHNICCEAYSQNFHNHWNNDGLQHYINDVFGIQTLKNELANKNIQYFMAFIGSQPVAFMKLNLFSNLPNHDQAKGIELDKIYILPKFKGMKIGRKSLDLAFDIAKDNNKDIFWLSVIDTNQEAISFYEKIGFKFHSKTQIDYPDFKEELRGMWRMYLQI